MFFTATDVRAQGGKPKKKAVLPPQNLTGALLENASYNFTSSGLKNISTLNNPTSLQFGPDNRLYVSQQNGQIKVLTIVRNAANDYTVTAMESITLINQIPNYNDDGTLNTNVTTRQVTGILVTGTASQPIIYVSSSDSRIGGGSTKGDVNLDTNSGIISRLTKSGSSWTKVDLVRGLPRSEENHSVNGMQLDEQTNTLFIAVGGFTNAGSPSNNFAFSCEYALAAAILSIDLNAINAMPTIGSGNTAYKYDIPTLDDPTRANNPNGTDLNDPFGGNDGLNQAKIVPGGPVQIYSPGYRNAYDIVITKTPGRERRMYTVDNGANQGWGGHPANEGSNGTVTNNYVSGEPGSTGPGPNDPQVNNLDNLHYIGNLDTYTPGSHYAGHPTPTRANPAGAGLYTHNGTTGVWRTSKTGANPLPADWPPLPLNMANPIEGDYQNPGVADQALLTFSASTNGIAEYTASNFNNGLKGTLLAASFDGKIHTINLTDDGTNVTNAKSSTNKLNQDLPFASGFGSQPLDLIAQGDDDIFPGSVWAATYGSNTITIFEPVDFTNCTGIYSTTLDDDLDGYSNADEIDNGTNPCSGSSRPDDFDGDFLSDLNDPDDDDDGLGDNIDYFALDAANGLTTNLPIDYNLFNNDPGTGLFGLGFTGLMSNKQLTNDYNNNFWESNLIAGGAVGAFSVVATSAGDALGTQNNQEYAFQFGVNVSSATSPFTVHTSMLGPFFNNQLPQNFQSQGLYIGTGDQDNYLKISINANGGLTGIEVVHENAGLPVSQQHSLPGGIPGSSLDLYFSVNPTTGTVQPKYSRDGGLVTNLGSPIQLSGALLQAVQGAPALAVGIISTSRNATPFTATWDLIKVSIDPLSSAGTWQTVTPASGAPTARHENALVQAGNKFYLVGGRGIKAVQEYNPATKAWVNKANTPMEFHHFQAVALDGLIYVVGAFTGSYPHETPVPNIHIYNPLTNKWFTGPAIPESRRRGSAGVVVHNNKIYMVGGIIDGHWSGWVSWFDEYDPATNTWKILPDAPRARDHFHAAMVGNKLYNAGGRRSSGITNEVFNLTIGEVDVYDFNSGQWATLPSSSNLPTLRGGTASAVLGNELIIMGGESASQSTAHKETEALDVTTNNWRRLADLQQGRHGTQAITSNQGIYIIAGSANKGGGPELATQEAFYLFSPTTPTGPALAQSALTTTGNIAYDLIQVGATQTKTLKLTNNGSNQAILVSSIDITGDNSFSYGTSVTLPFLIPVGRSVDVPVIFAPTSTGAKSAGLLVNHSGSGATTTIELNGSAQSNGLTASPAYLHFFSQQAGTTSTPQAIAFTNNQSTALEISAVAITGANSNEYAHTFTSAVTLAAGASTTLYVTFSPLSLGTKVAQLEVTHTGTDSPYTINLTGEGIDNTGVIYRINAGGPEVVNSIGTFAVDGFYAGGGVYTKTGEVAGTTDDAIYHTERSSSSNNGAFSYNFPVSNGQYKVVLHFAEIYWTASGQRIFDVSLEGIKVLDNYDIFGLVGARTARVESFTVSITDGAININFDASLGVGGKDRPKISAIEILGVSGSNQLPIANAGDNQIITLPLNSLNLDGSGTDSDGSITAYSWSQTSGPNTANFSSVSSASTTVSNLIAGSYTFQLTVTDDDGGVSLPDLVSVTVNPEPTGEVAYRFNAGGAQYTTGSNLVFGADQYFSFSGVYSKTSLGIAGTTDDALYQTERNATNFSYDVPVPSGTYKVKLHFAELYFTTTGSRIFDVLIENNTWLTNFDIVAEVGYAMALVKEIEVTVTDGTLNLSFISSIDKAKVSALEIIKSTPGANLLPVANAGADQTITLPVNSVVLAGSGTDEDGTISGYSWTQVDGPNIAGFSSKMVNNPTVIDLIAGSYVFSLTVTDDKGGISQADLVNVIVNQNASNIQEVVSYTLINAVTEQDIQTITPGAVINLAELPTSQLNIRANTNPVIIGSVKMALSGTQIKNTTESGTPYALFGDNKGNYNSWIPPLGDYTLMGTPYTSSGGAGTAGTSLTISFSVVNEATTNQRPVANAGNNQTLTLPTSSTGLNGSGTDSDGTISTYSWSQLSGPGTATFSSTSIAAPIVSNLIAGTYSFSLTVTDDGGSTSLPDQVSVTVNAAANELPAVSITSPANGTDFTAPTTITITASASDTDGTISKVEFYEGANKLGEDTTSPYSYTWSGVAANSYSLTAKAIDNSSGTGTSAVVNIVVAAPANLQPVVSSPIPNQKAVIGTAFSFFFDANTFTDPDNDVLTYTASQSNNTALPAWLSFNATTRSFSGTPPTGSPNSITIRVTASDGKGGTVSDEFILSISAPSDPSVAHRINSGGPQVNNSIGAFEADNYFSPTPGYVYSTTTAISGTTNDEMYQTARGSSSNRGTFDYVLPVSNGQYNVILHFAELNFSKVGHRIFDVSIEGSKKLDNYDIIRKTGANFTATTESFIVDVADGNLNIFFSAQASDGGSQRPIVSAIEVLVVSGTATSSARVGNISDEGLTAENTDADKAVAANEIVVYPNPFNDVVHVVIPSEEAATEYIVKLYSSLGTEFYTDRFSNKAGEQSVLEINLGNKPGLSRGLYFISVENTLTAERNIVKVLKE
ncbi:Kelch repeat-containing protein [Flammeovirgaceae bacterium 311]|nr:Kelch repeat-containing protein [Flammeovirgaceae bacterium 311]